MDNCKSKNADSISEVLALLSWSSEGYIRRYKNYQQVYTGGSKEESKVGCAVILDNHLQRIPDASSIFTAEAKAVYLALDFIITCGTHDKFIIFSYSLSVLKAMNRTSSKNQQIQKLLGKCHELLANKKICWIPGHVGITGKEASTNIAVIRTNFLKDLLF